MFLVWKAVIANEYYNLNTLQYFYVSSLSGLSRSGDIARMLPSEAVLMAAGRSVKNQNGT